MSNISELHIFAFYSHNLFPLNAVHFLHPMTDEVEESHMESIRVESRVKGREKEVEEEEKKEGEEKREGTRSRSSSTSSEDYIIILPDCFDTSRPLGESMYRYVPCQLGSNSTNHHALSWDTPCKNCYIYINFNIT